MISNKGLLLAAAPLYPLSLLLSFLRCLLNAAKAYVQWLAYVSHMSFEGRDVNIELFELPESFRTLS